MAKRKLVSTGPVFGWLLDSDGDGALSASDIRIHFQGELEDFPVAGKWQGGKKTLVGVYRHGVWLLDKDGTGTLNTVAPLTIRAEPGDIPVTGDWNADGRAKIGVFRPSGQWILDCGSGHTCFSTYGKRGDTPVVGRW